MNILLCDMHVTGIGKASPLMRYTNMVEQLNCMSDSFKHLDTVGKLRYKEKLGMLGVTTDPYSTSRLRRLAGPQSVFFEAYHKGCVNHDSSNFAIEAQNLNKPTPC